MTPLDIHAAGEVRAILQAHGLPDAGLTPSDGFANLVVLTPSHILRLNEGRFPQAFSHEARVLSELPPDIPHPDVVAHGERASGGEFMVLERLPGSNLETAWPNLTASERRRLIEELAEIVQRLHALPQASWMQNPWVERALRTERWRDAYHAPPHASARMIAGASKARPDVTGLLSRVSSFMDTRLDTFAGDPECFVHTDLHFRNVMVSDGRITGLLDFEGSWLGPPDVELEMLLRALMLRNQETARSDAADVVATFRSVYPGLFSHPALIERLEVYEALWHLVQLHHWKPGDRWTSDPARSLVELLGGDFAARARELLGD